MTIRCAICDRSTTNDTGNPWRPFCSERCKMLDLSRWLGGDYVIPGAGVPPEAADPDGDPDATSGSSGS